MDWNSLKCFLAIVETGSLSGAARRLEVNHSTMFRRLQAFEQAIGSRLFEKIDNRYVLTPMGEELLTYGNTIAEVFDTIERHIVGKDFLPKGVVKLTAPHNIANRYLPQALTKFRKDYPDIQIEVLSSNLEINMNSRLADVAIRATANPPEHLIGRKLLDIPWGIFSGSKGRKISVTLDDLSQYSLIGGTGQMLNLPAFRWLEQHAADYITTRCDELTTMSYFAQAGQGLAFLPMDQLRRGLRFLGEFTPGHTSGLWLLTHPDLRKTERIRLVMEYLSEYFQHLTFT